MSLDAPISLEEFSTFMQRLGGFEKSPALAVAVSGGADSLALALLLKQWIDRHGGSLTALTINHRLRREAEKEAEQTKNWLTAYNIPSEILTWEGVKPITRLQEKAREARYQLLESWCSQQGILHLFLGHHALDQSETFLMRLARGSTEEGLAGIPAVRITSKVRYLRPLLAVFPERLKATLKKLDQPFIEDPSNIKRQFSRVRWRQFLQSKPEGQLLAENILATVTKIKDQKNYQEEHKALLKQGIVWHPGGFLRLSLDAFKSLTSEEQSLLLRRLLVMTSGEVYPPRFQQLEALVAKLSSKGQKAFVLGGCCLFTHTKDLWICRELRAVEAPLFLQNLGTKSWDQRFKVTVMKPGPWTLKALGLQGTTLYRQRNTSLSLPARALWGVPSLWQDEQLYCVLDGSEESNRLFQEAGIKITFQPALRLT